MLTQDQVREAWDDVAVGYDEVVTDTHRNLAEEVLRMAGLRAGMRFLDVAAGSGGLSIPAAKMGAKVLATDISPVMIERFEARAREEGLSNLEGCVMDAHELELEDDSFDLVGSMFGVMLVPELGRALEEMRRVARPGGKVMVVTFGPVPQVEFLGFFTRAMKAVIPNFQGLPSDPPPLPFQVADPEKLRQAMDKAGLQDVHVARTTEALEFRSGQHLWNWVKSSNPIGARWAAGLAPEQVSAVQNKLDQMLDERAGEEDVAVLRIAVNVGIGRKDKRS